MKKALPNKFKLTPEVYKKLKQMATLMPQFQRRDKNKNLMFQGAAVFKGTSDWNEAKGTFVKNIDHGKVPLMVNHEVNLVEIYQKDGWKGINIYVAYFEKEHNDQMDHEAKLKAIEDMKNNSLAAPEETEAKVISMPK